MNKFWKLYEKNVIISGTLAVMLVGAVVILSVQGQPIPELLAALVGTVMGYFFGSGKAHTAIQTMKQ